jgi:2,3-bisphosphoglycerate-dependent phosphoglycerate mutase
MATLILARHGRTAANSSGTLAGRSKGVHLDDKGREQAAAAGERLSGLDLAGVWTSPLERCRETAKLLVPGATARVDRRLLECDYGDWTGKALKDLAKEKLWGVVQSQPSAARFPDGESLQEMSARVVGGVREHDAALTAEVGDHAVWLAVSHGDPIKAVLADALGMHLDAFQRIVVDPGSLSVVRYTPHRAFVVTLNSSSGSLAHLASKPPARKGRRRSSTSTAASDAAVGGGAGPTGSTA